MRIRKRAAKLFIIASFIISAGLWMTACEDSATTYSPPEAPEIPTGITATDGTYGNQVQISWGSAERAESYKIYKALDSETAEYRLVTGGITSTSWADTTVTPARIYYYRIVAVNAGGVSSMSDIDMGYAGELSPEPPFPPSDLYATGESLHHVYLRWDSVAGADRYHVYRADSVSGTYSRISDDDGIQPAELDTIDVEGILYSFDDSRMMEGKAYYYRVSAENGDGEGIQSQPVMGWFPYDTPDDPPASVMASDGTYSNKVLISWESVTAADTYSVYRSISTYNSGDCPMDSGSYSGIGTTTSLSFDDTTLGAADWNNYCYAVRANNLSGASPLSVPDKGFKAEASGVSPSAPVNLSATSTEINQITITWNNADIYAATYLVYRCATANGDYGDSIGTVSGSGTAPFSFTDTTANGITTDTVLYYKVQAVSSTGDASSLSNNTSGLALPTVPAAPVVTASDGADRTTITINWTEAARAVTYKIYRSTSVNGPWDATTILASKLTGTSYVDSSISFEFETNYYYAVRGVNSGGDGIISAADAGYVELATSAAPTTGDPGGTAISVTWTGVEGSQGYVVYWVRSTVWGGSSPSSTTGQFTVPGGSSLTATFTSGELWYRYRFQVAAYVTDGGGNITHIGPVSEWSGWESAD